MLGIVLSCGGKSTLKQYSNMRSTAAPGVDIVFFFLLSCYDSSITYVRQWLHIGEVDNVIIELWVSTSNTCPAAGRPSRQKYGTRLSMWNVEMGIVPSDRSAGTLAGKSRLVSLTRVVGVVEVVQYMTSQWLYRFLQAWWIVEEDFQKHISLTAR